MGLSVDELKIALGTNNDVNNGSSILTSSSFVSSALKGSASDANQRLDDDIIAGTGGPASKKTPGEIIYRDSSTFLKVVLWEILLVGFNFNVVFYF